MSILGSGLGPGPGSGLSFCARASRSRIVVKRVALDQVGMDLRPGLDTPAAGQIQPVPAFSTPSRASGKRRMAGPGGSVASWPCAGDGPVRRSAVQCRRARRSGRATMRRCQSSSHCKTTTLLLASSCLAHRRSICPCRFHRRPASQFIRGPLARQINCFPPG